MRHCKVKPIPYLYITFGALLRYKCKITLYLIWPLSILPTDWDVSKYVPLTLKLLRVASLAFKIFDWSSELYFIANTCETADMVGVLP